MLRASARYAIAPPELERSRDLCRRRRSTRYMITPPRHGKKRFSTCDIQDSVSRVRLRDRVPKIKRQSTTRATSIQLQTQTVPSPLLVRVALARMNPSVASTHACGESTQTRTGTVCSEAIHLLYGLLSSRRATRDPRFARDDRHQSSAGLGDGCTYPHHWYIDKISAPWNEFPYLRAP